MLPGANSCEHRQLAGQAHRDLIHQGDRSGWFLQVVKGIQKTTPLKKNKKTQNPTTPQTNDKTNKQKPPI